MPPQRNGIADYAAKLLHAVAPFQPSIVYCNDLAVDLPHGVEVGDPAQAFRHLDAASPILHQIGNNGGHVFVLEALRAHGGVVSLHDLSLLYLYELASPKLEEVLGRMIGPSGAMGEAYARHWREQRIKTAANYVLFDLIGEILSLSKRVIVHSRFARNKIAAVYGDEAAAKVDVVPHFAPALLVEDQEKARAAIGYTHAAPLVLTSGFATKAKRFDWLVDALDELAGRGVVFRWIHAGEERAAEFDLSAAIASRPALAGRCKISGYVSEEDLDAYIAACDVLVNLRFPSVGESSGTLARAFAAGRCCIVNDTAAYAELPRDAVVHLPVFGTVPALVNALEGLLGNPELRDVFGERVRLLARTELSMDRVARGYLATIAKAYESDAGAGPVSLAARMASAHRAVGEPYRLATTAASGADILRIGREIGLRPGDFELDLHFAGLDDFADLAHATPALLREALPAHVTLDSVRFKPGPDDFGVGLSIVGRSHTLEPST
jgi:glycosyltransferase involved in cell wall biosynthesis